MRPAGPKGSRSMSVTGLGALVLVLAVVLLAATNRAALARAFTRSRALAAAAADGSSSPAAAADSGEPEDQPRPNCGLPPLPANAVALCLAEQQKAFAESKGEKFWGSAGFDRVQGTLFNRYDGRPFFPRSRAINLVSVGAHFGGILDRYGALGRGPRLDDRIILVEPNPLTIQRLKGRIRLDHRLLLMPAAAYNSDGEAWLEYHNKKAESGGSGRVTKSLPPNATAAQERGEGALVRTITLDTLLKKMPGPIDFIMMDADMHEPLVLEGMKETLKRTRMVVFSCHSKWKEVGSATVADVVRDVFKPAGMTVSLLGEKRNLLLDEGVVPPELLADFPNWGFCVAMHTAPPIMRKVEEYTRMAVGDAWEGPCGALFASYAAPSCKGGVLETLAGVETPPALVPDVKAYY